jgi:hypothetical protein
MVWRDTLYLVLGAKEENEWAGTSGPFVLVEGKNTGLDIVCQGDFEIIVFRGY